MVQQILTNLQGVKRLLPNFFYDQRGFFAEIYSLSTYKPVLENVEFVQDNLSSSQYGTIRGMHFQTVPGQHKLIQVIQGEIFDVVVDIRPDSPTFKQWEGFYLSDKNREQLFVPIGFAHGFCVTSSEALVHYKVSSFYNASTEKGFKFDDPDIAIEWPVTQPVLSVRDQNSPRFHEIVW